MIRRKGQPDRLYAVMKLLGRDAVQQGDRDAVSRTGDFVVLDARSAVIETDTGSALVLDLPRERFEAMLGPTRLFTALTVGADLASTTLANTFIQELERVGAQLTPSAAARMASIGADLIMASLAERMAQEVPGSIHGNVTVRREKAYVEANLCNPSLDPPWPVWPTSPSRSRAATGERSGCRPWYAGPTRPGSRASGSPT